MEGRGAKRKLLLVVIKISDMGAVTEVSQVPHPQDPFLIPASQDIAGHPVPGNHIHICVRCIHAEHAAAAFSCVPNFQAVVNRTRCKNVGL